MKYIKGEPGTSSWLFDELYWGYEEAELEPDGFWTLKVLCHGNSEIGLTFRQIEAKWNVGTRRH